MRLTQGNKLLFPIFFFLLVATLSFSSASLELGVDSEIGIDLIPETPTNYSTVNVNNSQYLQGYTPTTLGSWMETTFGWITNAVNDLVNYYTKTQSDDRYVNIDGDTISGDLAVLGRGNFTAGLIASGFISDGLAIYGYDNIRMEVIAGSPKLILENDGRAYIIDEGGDGFRFYQSGENVTMRINNESVQIGDTTEDKDLLIYGDLEVNGTTYFDSYVFFYNYFSLYKPTSSQANYINFIESGNTRAILNSNFLHDQFVLYVDDYVGNQFILADQDTSWNNDFDHPVQANPTYYIHSTTAPNTANDEWISFTHDTSNALIGVGKGDIHFNYGTSGTDIAWFSGNISAIDYFTRTSVFDKSKNLWDYIKDADYYKNLNEIDHSKFYGFSTYETADYSKPINEEYDCSYFKEDEKTQNLVFIEKVCNRTIYPYNKTEEVVSLNKEIDVLRQGVYELKVENDLLKSELCKRDRTYSWCGK